MLNELAASGARRLALLGAALLALNVCVFTLRYPLLPLYSKPLLNLGLIPVAYAVPVLVAGWILLFGVYLGGWRACPERRSPALLVVILAGSVASGLALTLAYPVTSTDIFDYVARSHFVLVHHANAFTGTASAYSNDPYFRYVYWRDSPNFYGVLWTLQAQAVAAVAGPSLIANLIAYKVISLAYFWGSGLLVYATLSRVRPAYALRGALLYAWNPLLLLEFGANGHNDSVMVFWILVAFFWMARSQAAPALVALGLGALVKFVPLLLVPLFLVAIAKDPARSRRFKLVSIGAAAIALAVLTALLYLPYGAHGVLDSLVALRPRNGMFGNSPAAAVVWSLRDLFGVPLDDALRIVGAGVDVLAVYTVAMCTLRLARTPRSNSTNLFAQLVSGSSWLLLLLLALGSMWLMPWYLAWLVSVSALAWVPGHARRAVAFSFLGFAVYLMTFLVGYRLMARADDEMVFTLVEVALIFVPLAVVTALTLRPQSRRRRRDANPPPLEAAATASA